MSAYVESISISTQESNVFLPLARTRAAPSEHAQEDWSWGLLYDHHWLGMGRT